MRLIFSPLASQTPVWNIYILILHKHLVYCHIGCSTIRDNICICVEYATATATTTATVTATSKTTATTTATSTATTTATATTATTTATIAATDTITAASAIRPATTASAASAASTAAAKHNRLAENTDKSDRSSKPNDSFLYYNTSSYGHILQICRAFARIQYDSSNCYFRIDFLPDWSWAKAD